MAKRKAAIKARDTSGEVWIRVASYKRKYYISRPDLGLAGRTDDEAQLEIVATIEAISPAHKKQLGAALDLSLLSAQHYNSDGPTVSPFFGSITLRGSQRSALAYLPPKPFWELPAVIGSGATHIALGWTSMHRGHASLTSVFVGDETDFEQMAGHVAVTMSDIYALPDPANLGRALAVTQSIIDEIDQHAPGAFKEPLTALLPLP